ncbi:MAG: 50S ribosomal protein L19e [archaeon]
MNAIKAKELAAVILKCGVNRIYIDPATLTRVTEAMTKDDLRQLIAERIIKKRATNAQSRARINKMKAQRRKGRRRGKGKRTGTKKSRTEQRSTWIDKVRAQRALLRELKKTNPEAVKEKGYSQTYKRIKGGFFKGKNYLREYIEGGKTQ